MNLFYLNHILKNQHRFTFNRQDADLTKVASVTQDDKLRDAVVGNNSQFSLLDDVHLSANVALLTDVVSGAVDLRLQLQHQLHQQAGLAVGKDTNLHNDTEQKPDVFSFTSMGFNEEGCQVCADLLEGVQVDVDGDLGSEFVRQVLQHLPLIHCFFIGPQEVKPLDHSLLQVLSYLEGILESCYECSSLKSLS